MGTDGENRLHKLRMEKVEQIRELGVDPYVTGYHREHMAQVVHHDMEGKSPEEVEDSNRTYILAGRAVAIRSFGKAAFLQLEDSSGRIQIFVKRDDVGEEAFKGFRKWDVGDIVGISGTPFVTRSGELTVLASGIRLLTKSVRPLPEKWHGLKDVELRYRQRYVDLIANPQVREIFRVRSSLISNLRRFLDSRGFMEVETPMMQPIAGGAVARPFVTHHNVLDMDLYLRIAPELYLKRLVVGGFEKVYELNRNFRNEGVSTMHNPEFTMLEFYMAYADYQDMMDFTEELFREVVQDTLGDAQVAYQGKAIDFSESFQRRKFSQCLLEVDGFGEKELKDHGMAEVFARDRDIAVDPKDPLGKIHQKIFDRFVEPGLQDPVFVHDYPVDVSPLSRRSDKDPEIAERFELFIAGMEVANGFSELNDPRDQESRFLNQVAEREAGDDEAHMMDNDYIRALEYGLPPTAGEGIGIDRLTMLLTDAASIREVIFFPHQRSEQP